MQPALNIREAFVSYVSGLAPRPADAIDLVVIHCTELPDLALAREYGERIHYAETGTGNCGHFYVERSGAVEQWAPVDRVAHHVRHYNERSIGIELVNSGRYPNWFDSASQQMQEPYPPEQVFALNQLLQFLVDAIPTLGLICGHSDLDTSTVPATDDPNSQVRRKLDPGPCFPWPDVLDANSLKWFEPLTCA